MQINNSFQKNANMSMVAQLLWRYPGISRIDLAKRLGVYRSTISNIINAMVDNGIVLETKEDSSSSVGGRKPLRLTLNPEFGCITGIELQPSGYTAVVTDFNGVIRISASGSLPSGEFHTLPEQILNILEPDIQSVGLAPLAVCVGLPGIINSCDGIVVRSDIFNAHAVSFPQSTTRKLGVPLFIENEANCIAWHELLRVRDRECRSFLCVNTEFTREESRFSHCNGLAVGIGVALNGRVYNGSRYAAGEFVSHTWNGSMVGQGNFQIPAGGITDADPISSVWVRELFESMVSVLAILDPHAIIVHGEFARHRDLVQKIIDTDVPRFNDILKKTGCELFFAAGDTRSVALGAAHMFLMKSFSVGSLDESVAPCLSWDEIINCAQRNTGQA